MTLNKFNFLKCQTAPLKSSSIRLMLFHHWYTTRYFSDAENTVSDKLISLNQFMNRGKLPLSVRRHTCVHLTTDTKFTFVSESENCFSSLISAAELLVDQIFTQPLWLWLIHRHTLWYWPSSCRLTLDSPTHAHTLTWCHTHTDESSSSEAEPQTHVTLSICAAL